MTRKSECEVDNISVFDKLSSVTSKGTGKLDCILHRAQITIKKYFYSLKQTNKNPNQNENKKQPTTANNKTIKTQPNFF